MADVLERIRRAGATAESSVARPDASVLHRRMRCVRLRRRGGRIALVILVIAGVGAGTRGLWVLFNGTVQKPAGAPHPISVRVTQLQVKATGPTGSGPFQGWFNARLNNGSRTGWMVHTLSCVARDSSGSDLFWMREPEGSVAGEFVAAGASRAWRKAVNFTTAGPKPASFVCHVYSGEPGSPAPPPPSPVAPGFQSEAVSFWSEQRGLIVGGAGCATCQPKHGGVVAETTDGGTTWHVVDRSGRAFFGVATWGSSNAWAWTRGALFRSTNAGRTWRVAAAGTFGRVSFASPSFGWASDGFEYSTNKLLQTTDGGRTWTTLHDPCTQKPTPGIHSKMRNTSTNFVSDVSAVAPGRGWVLCEGAGNMDSAPEAIYETSDDGRSWTLDWSALDSYIGGFQMRPGGSGLFGLSETGAFEQTVDGGHSWRNIGDSGDGTISLSMTSNSAAYSLSYRSLLKTDDGGRTWHIVTRFPSG